MSRYNGPLRLRDITLQEAIHFSFVLRLIRNLWQKRLTPSGRICIVLVVVFGLNSAVGLVIPMYIPWAFLLSLLLVSRLSTIFAMGSVTVLRHSIMPVSAGQQLVYDIEVTNTSKRTLYDLEVAEWYLPFEIHTPEDWTHPCIESLAPGASMKVRMKLDCTKRGSYVLPCPVVMSAFPLGIWRGIIKQPQATSFQVYPAFQPMMSFDVPHSRQYQPGGILLSSQVGESSEFMHTREYRAGDNPRHLHWASWARQSKPIVKVYQEEYFVRLALLLDCEWADRKNDAPFEAAVSLAAGIADILSRKEYIIDMFAAGEDIHHFQAGRSLAHFEHILEILSYVYAQPSIDWDRLSAAVVPQAAQFSSIALVLLDWDPYRQQLFEKFQLLGLNPLVFVVRDGETTLPLPKDPKQFVLLKPDEDFSNVRVSSGQREVARGGTP